MLQADTIARIAVALGVKTDQILLGNDLSETEGQVLVVLPDGFVQRLIDDLDQLLCILRGNGTE